MARNLTAFVLIWALMVGAAALQPAAADPPPGDPEPWRINLALYGWAMSVAGNVTVRNQTLDTNASFLDLVQKSNSASTRSCMDRSSAQAFAFEETMRTFLAATCPPRPTRSIRS